MGRIIASCMIGNIIEWYDFIIYALFASTIGSLFFPASSDYSQIINAFAIYAVGFIARPIGAIVFGHIGDKKSRKDSLMLSIYIMAIPTALIGCIPTYAQAQSLFPFWESAGLLAPVLLTILRLFQSFAIGGEFTGSMVFMVESAPPHRRGFFGSWATFSSVLGVILGSVVAFVFSSLLSPEQMQSWGWRIPFVLSIFGSLVGTYIRRSLSDPERFVKKKKHGLPIKMLMSQHLGKMSLVFFIDIVTAIGFFTLVTFLPSFMQDKKFLGMPQDLTFKINTFNMLVFALFTVVGGSLSDKFGRRPILAIGAAALALMAFPIFGLLASGALYNVVLGQAIMAVIMGTFFGVIPAALSELFPTEVRFSGLSLAHNLSMAIFGGTAPLIATQLVQHTGSQLSPAWLLVIAGVVCLAALPFYFDRQRIKLADRSARIAA